MSYKAITIYTPEGSTPHIAAADDAFIHDSLAGGRSGILGSLCCQRVDNTTVRLSGGGVSNMGYVMYIPNGATHDLTVETGTQSLMRYDLVVSHFQRGSGDTADTHTFKIVQGTASASPADPKLMTSSLLSAGDINQTALFRVVLNGLSIERIELIAPSVSAQEYIKCCASDSEITPVSGEITQIDLSAYDTIASGRCLSVENGAVVCAVDGVVEIAGSVYMKGTADPQKYYGCYVMQNGVELTPGIRPAVLYGAVSTPLQMVSVSAGDIITLHCRTDAESGSCLGGHSSTWLTVRYI